MDEASKWIIIGGLGAAGFIIYTLLQRYKQEQPAITTEKYYCPACNAGPFSTYDELVKHYQQAHPEIPEIPPEPAKVMALRITKIYADDTQIYG